METIEAPTKTKAIKDHRCDFCNAIIPKGSTYIRSVHKFDIVYACKTHEHCAEIATKLRMYESCDEGVDADAFCECINDEHQELMNRLYPDEAHVKHSEFAKFNERLSFVLEQHGISQPLNIAT